MKRSPPCRLQAPPGLELHMFDTISPVARRENAQECPQTGDIFSVPLAHLPILHVVFAQAYDGLDHKATLYAYDDVDFPP